MNPPITPLATAPVFVSAGDFALAEELPQQPMFTVQDVNQNGVYDMEDLLSASPLGVTAAADLLVRAVDASPSVRAVTIGHPHKLMPPEVTLHAIARLSGEGHNPALCLEYDADDLKGPAKKVAKLSPQELSLVLEAKGDVSQLSPDIRNAYEKVKEGLESAYDRAYEGEYTLNPAVLKQDADALMYKLAHCAKYSVPVVFIDEIPTNSIREENGAIQQVPYRDAGMAINICQHDGASLEDGQQYLYVIEVGALHAANDVIEGQGTFEAANMAGRKTLAECLSDPRIFGDDGVMTFKMVSDPELLLAKVNAGMISPTTMRAELYPFEGYDRESDADNYPYQTWDHVVRLNETVSY